MHHAARCGFDHHDDHEHDSTTTSTTTSTTAASTTAASTTVPPLDIVGSTLAAVWDRPGTLQQYYGADGSPTGLFSGTRMPVRGGAPGGVLLGFAERSGRGQQREVADEFDGVAMLLTFAGDPGPGERYVVQTALPLAVAAGEGMVIGARCDSTRPDDFSHVLRLRFGQDGPDVVEAWRIDASAGEFIVDDPATIGCRGFKGAPVAADGTGMLALHDGVIGVSATLDLSGATPATTAFVEVAGRLVGSQRALGLMRRGTDEVVWLEDALGWDDTGTPVWRVVASQVMPARAAGEATQTDCRRADGALAIGIGPIDQASAAPRVAWVVDPTGHQFVPTDPAGVTCTQEGTGD